MIRPEEVSVGMRYKVLHKGATVTATAGSVRRISGRQTEVAFVTEALEVIHTTSARRIVSVEIDCPWCRSTHATLEAVWHCLTEKNRRDEEEELSRG